VAEFLDGLADADRIERRAEGGLGEEGDGLLAMSFGPPLSVHEDAGVGGGPADLDRVAGHRCRRPLPPAA
jgi:hypothetical protein